jgi:hypothetical protein
MELRHPLFTHVWAGKDTDTARSIKVTRGPAVGLQTAPAFDRGWSELSPAQTDGQCSATSAAPSNVHAQVHKPTPGAHHRVPVMLVYSTYEGLPSLRVPCYQSKSNLPCHRNRGVAHVTHWPRQVHRFPVISPSWKPCGAKTGWRSPIHPGRH